MSDVCHCPGGDCPLKESCLRYLRKPGIGELQFLNIPYADGKCSYQIKCRKKIPIAPQSSDVIIEEK